MATFKYKARDRSGKLIAGAATFQNEEEARAFLRANRLMALEIQESAGKVAISGDFLKTLKKIDLVTVVRQLAIMIRTGVSLDRAFDVLLDQDHHPHLTAALRATARDVHQGSTLSDGLAKHPKIFPDLLIALVRAGEAGGNLDKSLEEAARQMVWQRELRQKAVTAMMYPGFTLVMAIGLVAVMLVMVVPNFVQIYAGSGVDLPWPTRFLISASDFMLNKGWMVVLATIAAALGFKKYASTETGKRQLDRLRLKFPIIGGTIRKICVANFCRTLELLLEAGVPILSALRVAADSSGSPILCTAVSKVSDDLAQGQQMAGPLQATGYFPPLVTRLVAVGEMTGTLGEVLREIVYVYAIEVDEEMKRAVSLMEPLMVVVLGGIVGSLVLALYMPIFDIINVVAK
jgi:type IV pilus assembly protein PilC